VLTRLTLMKRRWAQWNLRSRVRRIGSWACCCSR